jgi:hypothetical protein
MTKLTRTAMILGLMACSGAALAQTYAQQSPAPTSQQAPTVGSSQPSSDMGGNASSGMTMSQKHAAMKSCMAQQQQSNAGMSKDDAKKACKAQLKSQS